MSNPISNFDELIDSRDVINRIAELESNREDLVNEIKTAQSSLEAEESKDEPSAEELAEINGVLEAAKESLGEFDTSDEGEELEDLKALQDEAEGYADWIHGAILVHDDYFQEYAQNFAEDLGMDRTQPWPYSCIDWEKAADELKQDFTSVDFDGETFWIH
jgi:transcriptional regulator with XRE-family HTH domain